MDRDVFIEQLLAGRSDLRLEIARLPDAEAAELVEQLKAEADRHWWINANRSLELAELIVRIGQARGDAGQTALGAMARADALRFLGQIECAWSLLETAGELFRQAGLEVGWARTRIGRLLSCVELNRVPEALADAEAARAIFARHGELDRLARLEHNIAIVYGLLGQYERALERYHSALAIAEALGERGRWHLPLLATDTGYTYHMLGDLRQAARYYQQAHAVFVERNETRGVALAEVNLAHLAMLQGQHRRALQLLHHAHDLYVAERSPLDATYASQEMVEGYLLLNRYADARDLARQVIAEYRAIGAAYREGLTLLHLAAAEAELGDFDAAQAALDTAEPIFANLDSPAWAATTQLRRGQIALKCGDSVEAARAAGAALTYFEAGGDQISRASARLLRGQASLAQGEPATAREDARCALSIAQANNVASLRYSAHLLLGRVAEAQGRGERARRRYTAAVATVERVQRGLTITLRPGFLEDKGEALRALLALHLRSGSTARAFEALERAKSQVLLGYLANREQLRWAHDDGRTRALIDELNQLREEHQWFYRLAHDGPAGEDDRRPTIDPRQALAEVATRERRMRAITEQLYLHSGEPGAEPSAMPSLQHIQRQLGDETLLIEYYNDGAQLWAFTLDARTLEVHRLPLAIEALDRLLAQLQLNLAGALAAGPRAPVARNLSQLAQRLAQRLAAGLLAPLEGRTRGRRRLIVVPYGALHYLPFHLLHDGSAYLIERHELVVLPAAGLATRRSPRRSGGALALAHSWGGRLPQTLVEARAVQRMFGGAVLAEEQACRTALQAQPAQILHIAAHGEHRLDQPDLSYIQLADGQLYTDDLLQHDLSYELVTLSACETGRARVAGGDELIGLGRGFLYAGAGALITSLWRIADDTTVALMERIYGGLRTGASKAAAVRNAQLAVLVEDPQLHPAFWGAFQLVGDAGPLSADYRNSDPIFDDRRWTTDDGVQRSSMIET